MSLFGPFVFCVGSQSLLLAKNKTRHTKASFDCFRPVPEPGHLRRAGLSQSPPKEVPRRYLRQNRLAGLERHNGQRARPSSVGRCADRREIPCSEGASSTELIWTVPSLWSVVLAKSTVVVRTAG